MFERVQKLVLPDRKTGAEKEDERNREALDPNPAATVNRHHANFLDKWWLLAYPRRDLISAISKLGRYIACGRITLRPIFDFVSMSIRPSDVVVIFPYGDDYSFGILQSDIRWTWFVNRCSTLTGRHRYTSNTVFDSLPWPQEVTLNSMQKVAREAVASRKLRRELKQKHNMSFRELYRTLELPGASPVKDAHARLGSCRARGIRNEQV